MQDRVLTVFLASPGGLEAERMQLRRVIGDLRITSNGEQVSFRAVGWEDHTYGAGQRIQAVINTSIDACDVFVFMLHRRWGATVHDQTVYSSRTEEELHRAMERHRLEGNPEMLLLIKRLPTDMPDPGDMQVRRVRQFLESVEDAQSTIIHYFASMEQLGEIAVREIAGAAERVIVGAVPRAAFVMPLLATEHIAREVRRSRLAEAREQALAKRVLVKPDDADDADQVESVAEQYAHALLLEIADDLERDGEVRVVEKIYRAVMDRTGSGDVLENAFSFWCRRGRLAEASEALERMSKLASASANVWLGAVALSCESKLHHARGDGPSALESSRHAVEAFRGLDDSAAMAREMLTHATIVAESGNVELCRGAATELEEVVEFFRRGEMHAQLAAALSTRGLLMTVVDEVHAAVNAHEQALRLFRNIEHRQGESNEHYNLATIYLRDPAAFVYAAPHLAQCHAIKTILDDQIGLARCERVIGLLMRKLWSMDPFDSYLSRGERALRSACERERRLEGRKTPLAANMLDLAEILAWRGESTEAVAMLNAAAKLFAVSGFEQSVARCRNNAATIVNGGRPQVPATTAIQRRSAVAYRGEWALSLAALDEPATTYAEERARSES